MEPGPAQANSDGKPLKRKRGAQPGNTNALKHGLYARPTTQLERDNFNDPSVLDSEIAMLRTAIWCLFNRAHDADQQTLAARLTALARASAALARLIEATRQVQGRENAVLDTIDQAVSQIDQELSLQGRASKRPR